MKRYRQKFLNHALVVSQEFDGTWSFEILGTKRIHQQKGYHTALEAKQAAHLLAHWLLENKQACDCTERLLWSEERS
jgi:hypothetical protein